MNDPKVKTALWVVVAAVVAFVLWKMMDDHKKPKGGAAMLPPPAPAAPSAIPAGAPSSKITAAPAAGALSTMQGLSASMYPLKTPCGPQDWTLYAPASASTLNSLVAGFQAGVDTIGPARKYRYRGLVQPPVADRRGFAPPFSDSSHGWCESTYWPNDVLPF